MPIVLGRGRDLALGPTRVTNLILVGRCHEGDFFPGFPVGGLNFVPRATGRKQVPAKAAIANRALGHLFYNVLLQTGWLVRGRGE